MKLALSLVTLCLVTAASAKSVQDLESDLREIFNELQEAVRGKISDLSPGDAMDSAPAEESPAAEETLQASREAGTRRGLETKDHETRDLVQFGLMIYQLTGKSPLAYNGYGCYCGWGGSGSPVDNIDRCCQVHDNCYGRAGQSTYHEFATKVFPYVFWNHGGVLTCYNPSRSQARLVCECDKAAAECFRRYDREYHGKPSCPSSANGCSDNNRNCNFWARNNECRLNRGYMLKNCRKSCNACGYNGGK